MRPFGTAVIFGAARVALMGTRVTCPCCGTTLRRFLRYPTLICPRCGAYERHRQLCLFLDAHPELISSRDVLQVSPERSIVRRYQPRSRSWLTIDIDHPLADRRMDVQELALPDASFDFMLCSHVLDVVPDAHRALRELYRVLRPDGMLILLSPAHWDARAHADAAGFRVEPVVLDAQQDSQSRERLGLDGEPLFVCKP